MKSQKLPFAQALGAGALAGMRTSAAPVVVSHILSQSHSYDLEDSPLSFMQSKITAGICKASAISEIIIDKLPFTPNRILPGGVAGRCLSGALAGAALYKAKGGNMAAGALLGATAAFAATFASFYLRRAIVKKTKIFDPIIGAAEDALVVIIGTELCRMEDVLA